MAKYQVKVITKEFLCFLTDEWLKTDTSVSNAKNLKGSKWFKPIENAINQVEPDLTFRIFKSRLYEDSKKSGSYLTINAHCKACDSKYYIKLNSKPKLEDDHITFNVERSKDHDPDKHNKIYKRNIQAKN